MMESRTAPFPVAALCAAPMMTVAAGEQDAAHGDGHGGHAPHVSLTSGAADRGHLDETGLSIDAEQGHRLSRRWTRQ
jgi:hypothetical protein